MMDHAEQIGFELKEIPDGMTLQQALKIEQDVKEKEGSSIAIGSRYFNAEVPVSEDGDFKRFVCRMTPSDKSTNQDNNNNKETDAFKTSASMETVSEVTEP